VERDALLVGGLDLLGIGRHVQARAPVDDVHFGRSRRQAVRGGVHGDVAAADDRHAPALDRRGAAEGHLPQEVRAVDDPGRLLARDSQAQAAMGPDGHDHGLETFAVE